MSRIRPFQPGDEPALAHVCIKTADAGTDASGLLSDDEIWPAIFVLPYVARYPDFAFVAETEDGRVAGYVVAAPDTDEYVTWFRDEWWPRYADRFPRPTRNVTREDEILAHVYDRAPGTDPHVPEYPAHLHVDLLPELQRQGMGRQLIERLKLALREAGVPGVHLVAGADNAGASAFYPRIGFDPLPSAEGVRAFGMKL